MTDEETTERKMFEVRVTAEASMWVTVEAEDEDEAHDLAKDEAMMAPTGRWLIESPYSVDEIVEVVA